MRKILLSAVLLAGSLAVGAQESGEPNRLLVVSENDTYKSFMTERVKAIEFNSVDGPVKAEVKINKATLNTVETTITMTPDCSYYLLNCYPAVIARQIMANPAGAFSYMLSSDSPSYNEDFPSGTLSGLEFSPNTEYALVTAAYDRLGTECDVCMATFTTPSLPLAGDPKVTFKQTGSTYYTISGEFTPNGDVGGYSYLIDEKGMLPGKFEQFASMFGFANMEEMVKMWGVYVAHDEFDEHTWKDLEPNKDYEIYVQVWDKKDVAAPMQIFEASTSKMGGAGEAYVDIKVGAYKLADWDGEMKPSLYVTFQPNDQAGAYRVYCAYASDYDQNPQDYHDYVCSDPEMDIANWFLYGTQTTDYQVEPGAKIVILAAAKNVNGEWGKVNVMRYDVPSSVAAGMPAATGKSSIGVRPAPAADKTGKARTPRRIHMVK